MKVQDRQNGPSGLPEKTGWLRAWQLSFQVDRQLPSTLESFVWLCAWEMNKTRPNFMQLSLLFDRQLPCTLIDSRDFRFTARTRVKQTLTQILYKSHSCLTANSIALWSTLGNFVWLHTRELNKPLIQIWSLNSRAFLTRALALFGVTQYTISLKTFFS